MSPEDPSLDRAEAGHDHMRITCQLPLHGRERLRHRLRPHHRVALLRRTRRSLGHRADAGVHTPLRCPVLALHGQRGNSRHVELSRLAGEFQAHDDEPARGVLTIHPHHVTVPRFGGGWGMSRAVGEVSMSLRRTDGKIDEDLIWSTTGVDVFEPSMPWRTFRWRYRQKHYSGTH